MKMKEQFKGILALLGATVIWGFAFIAQSVGMDLIGPFTFQMVRCLLAVAFLVPLAFLLDIGKCSMKESFHKWKNPKLWKASVSCGAALFMASSLQQNGLVYTDAGKAGFLTAMYIVLVPVLGLFFRRKCGLRIWFSVALAVGGLYLLSCVGVTRVNLGDILILGSALCFAVQILLIDYLAQSLDGLRLNCVQFLVVTVLSALAAVLTEDFSWQGVLDCAVPLLYAGVLSSGVAFSLQILGQQHLPPEPASLIMSLESVFAVLSGWVILGQILSPTEAVGCCLVFAGVILCQIKAK